VSGVEFDNVGLFSQILHGVDMRTSKQKVLVGFITSVAIIFVIIDSEQGFASDRQLASNDDSKTLKLVCTGEIWQSGYTGVRHLSLRSQNEVGSYTEYRINASTERWPIRTVSDCDSLVKHWESVFYMGATPWREIPVITPEAYYMGLQGYARSARPSDIGA
jgi:hypothetical protein